MTHTQWHASITAEGIDTVLPNDLERLHQAVPGATSHDATTGRLTLSWRLEASTLIQATEQAMKTSRAALRDVYGTATLVDIRVRTADDHEREAAHPPTADLVGYKEAAEILGVTRTRVGELRRTRDDFPAPVVDLAAGPVFTAESVRRFDAGWVRKTGRPRKPTTATA